MFYQTVIHPKSLLVVLEVLILYFYSSLSPIRYLLEGLSGQFTDLNSRAHSLSPAPT